MDVGSAEFKRLQGEIKKASDEIDKLEGKASKGGAKKKAKTAEQIAKDEIDAKEKSLRAQAQLDTDFVNVSARNERDKALAIKGIQTQLAKDLKELNGKSLENDFDDADARLKKVEETNKEIKNSATDAFNQITKAEDDSVKKVGEYAKKIDDLKAKIQELKDDATKNIRSINQELTEVDKDKSDTTKDTYVKIAERRVQLLQDEKDMIADIAKEDDPVEKAKKQQALLAIQKEIAVIQDKIPSQILNEAVAKKALTQTEQDLLDLKQKQADLDEKRAGLLQQKAVDLAVANGRQISFTGTGDDLKAFYEDEKGNLVEITDFKAKEYAIDTQAKIAEYTNQIAEQQKFLDAELLNLQTLDANRRALETAFTAFFGTEIDNRNAKLREYIAMAQEAQTALSKINLDTQSAAVSATTSDTKSSSVKNVNSTYNISNGVDVQSATREIEKVLKQ